MAKWAKVTPYGDYSDPLQNHKFDKEMHFVDDKMKIVTVRTKQHELLHQCRVLFTHGKHVGSKPHYRLKNAISTISKARELYNKMRKQAETNTSKEAGNK